MNRFRVFIAFCFVILFTIFFHYMGWLSLVEKGIRSFISNFTAKTYSWNVFVNNETQVFSSVSELEGAYMKLLTANQECSVDEAKRSVLTAENENLKAELKFVRDKKFKYVGAHVIGRGIDPLENTIVIDRGSASGIAVSDPIIISNGILVGQVVQVQSDTSLVRLLEDSQSRVGVTFVGNDTTLGVLEGGYGISLHINFIPQNEVVEIGQTVITSGLSGDLPKGLVIGAIEAVERQPYEPFQRAVVTPLSQSDVLSMVVVLVD